MVAIIVAGHGRIAAGMVEAAKMIFGGKPELEAITFENKEGIEDLKRHYQSALVKFRSEKEVLFLIDIFGGSPYNAAIQLAYGKKGIEVLTGVNLPLLLEALSLQNQPGITVKQLAEHLKKYSQQSFKIFSEEVRKTEISRQNQVEDDLS